MYTKHELTRIRETFWTTFGKYMAPIPSADGEKINWINYKTGVKNVRIIMQAENNASVGIYITHSSDGAGFLHYNKLLELKAIFTNTVQGEWEWHPAILDSAGKTVSAVYTNLPGKGITNPGDWPAIISFFKANLIMLDEFWGMVKNGFDSYQGL